MIPGRETRQTKNSYRGIGSCTSNGEVTTKLFGTETKRSIGSLEVGMRCICDRYYSSAPRIVQYDPPKIRQDKVASILWCLSMLVVFLSDV